MALETALKDWKNRDFPTFEELTAECAVVSLPLKVKFRGVTHREVFLFRGPAGWGEFSPFLEYEPAEASLWLLAGIEAAWLGFPAPVREQIPVNATLPAVAAEEVARVLSGYEGDIKEIKVKVAEKGQTLADDLARLQAAQAFAPEARLKVDANMGWTLAEALTALEALEDFNLLYVEQPVASVQDLARLREKARNRGLTTLIAADESVRKASDPLRVARLGAADLLIIKAAPLGGVRSALALVQEAGLPAVVSSALDSSVGISMGAALAASLPELTYGCGLSTISLFEQDVAARPLIAQNGYLDLRTVEPDPEKLLALQASPDRRSWWLARVKASYQLLADQLPADQLERS